MNPDQLYIFIPIVAMLVVFGFPVALVFTLKWFKLKDRELQLEAEYRKTSGQALEARVRRLESIILALDTDVRSRLGTGEASGAELFEAPATQEGSQAPPQLGSPGKVR
jgi:hypothetical protein